MNLFEFERILNRYLKGKATEEEKQFIEHWLTIREADQQKLNEQEHYHVKNAIWTGIGRRTGLSGDLNQMGSIRRMIAFAAAITLLLIGTLWLFHQPLNKAQTFLTPVTAARGEKKTIRLSDSTLVHLFPGSSLAIADHFNETDRQVSVTGRAFFEVQGSPVKPFVVQAGKLQTTVLGTSFEVIQADSAENIVTVRSGKVSVAWDKKDLGNVSPDTRLRYTPASGQWHTEEVNAAALCEWWNYGLAFRQTTLQSIAYALGRWYNVKVNITNDAIRKETVTIRFAGKDLNEDLKLLSLTIPVQFTITNQQLIIH